MKTKAEQYVHLRLQGCGSREAARKAGFEAGVPGGHALELFGTTQHLLSCRRQTRGIDAQLSEAEEEVRRLRKLARAKQIIEEVT